MASTALRRLGGSFFLTVVAKAMAPASRLLLVERVIAPPDEGRDAKFSDLNMKPVAVSVKQPITFTLDGFESDHPATCDVDARPAHRGASPPRLHPANTKMPGLASIHSLENSPCTACPD